MTSTDNSSATWSAAVMRLLTMTPAKHGNPVDLFDVQARWWQLDHLSPSIMSLKYISRHFALFRRRLLLSAHAWMCRSWWHCRHAVASCRPQKVHFLCTFSLSTVYIWLPFLWNKVSGIVLIQLHSWGLHLKNSRRRCKCFSLNSANCIF